jgi:hypothetical protein
MMGFKDKFKQKRISASPKVASGIAYERSNSRKENWKGLSQGMRAQEVTEEDEEAREDVLEGGDGHDVAVARCGDGRDGVVKGARI